MLFLLLFFACVCVQILNVEIKITHSSRVLLRMNKFAFAVECFFHPFHNMYVHVSRCTFGCHVMYLLINVPVLITEHQQCVINVILIFRGSCILIQKKVHWHARESEIRWKTPDFFDFFLFLLSGRGVGMEVLFLRAPPPPPPLLPLQNYRSKVALQLYC